MMSIVRQCTGSRKMNFPFASSKTTPESLTGSKYEQALVLSFSSWKYLEGKVFQIRGNY